jgi:hypothetical protein
MPSEALILFQDHGFDEDGRDLGQANGEPPLVVWTQEGRQRLAGSVGNDCPGSDLRMKGECDVKTNHNKTYNSADYQDVT